jgi:hypothetical protein
MNVRYGIALLLFSILTLVSAPDARAQRPTLLSFTEVPCDSTACNAMVLRNSGTSDERIRSLRFRDGTDFRIDSSAQRPGVIPAGDQVAVQVCFLPTRRGTISDSLLMIIETPSGLDSVRVRMTGRGVGPELNASPGVLNFPKTNPGGSATLKMRISNRGERPFQLASSALNIPAPFRLVTPASLPVTIPARDSIEIEVAFEPTAGGIHAVVVDLPGGCARRVPLGFNGATDLPGIGAVLRSSKISFNPINNEQVACGISQCTDVTFSNVGNVPLIIDSLAWARTTSGFTMTSGITLPLTIPANSQQVIRVCVEAPSRGVIRDTLVISSNTRNSIAFGLVMDISPTMITRMDCGDTNKPQRIEETRRQARSFLQGTLLHIPTIGLQDEIAINEFADSLEIHTVFARAAVTDIIRQQAIDALDTVTAWGTLTFTGRGLMSMMSMLRSSVVRDRVIILMTDGASSHSTDQAQNPTSFLISEANRQGIRIFVIGIGLTDGDGVDSLKKLATGTRGLTFFINNCDSLRDAFETITDIVSRGTITREPFAVRVVAPVVTSSGGLSFDSTYIRTERCDTLTLINTGEGDAVVDTVDIAALSGGGSDFSLDPGITLPLIIPESGQIKVPVCFSPSTLRTRSATLKVRYNSCQQEERTDTLLGVGYAIANLRISDQRAALPGAVVTIPVYGDSTLAGYGVDTIVYTIRWNKTMLALRDAAPGTAAPSATVTVKPAVFDDRFATTEMMITGSDLASPGELVRVEFDVLRGDTLATTIELIAGTFKDGNPRTLLSAETALVAYDSTCFRSGMAVRRRTSAKVIAGEALPTPAEGSNVTLPVIATAETNVAVELYSMDGTLVRPAEHYRLHAGTDDLHLDLGELSAGRYYALIRTADGDIHLRTIILAR